MRTLLALLCLALVPSLLGAQGREPSRSDDGPLVSRGDTAIGAGFVLVVRFHDRDDDDDEVVPDGGSPGATVLLTVSGGGLSLGVGPGW
jgi:hypothetical protein